MAALAWHSSKKNRFFLSCPESLTGLATALMSRVQILIFGALKLIGLLCMNPVKLPNPELSR